MLLRALREHGLQNTQLAHAQCDTIRLKLLKIGAIIRFSVRRVIMAMSESYPYQELFARVHANLAQLNPARPLQLALE